MHIAAEFNDNPAIITALADAGANLEDRNNVRGGSFAGWTPLHMAAAHNDSPAIITALADAGANLEARNNGGWTPLHEGADFSHHPDVISALLDAGADVNARDPKGNTPLHWAAGANDNPEITAALLEGGADVNAQNDEGKTPLDYADNSEVIAVLRAAGGMCGSGATFTDGRCRPSSGAVQSKTVPAWEEPPSLRRPDAGPGSPPYRTPRRRAGRWGPPLSA